MIILVRLIQEGWLLPLERRPRILKVTSDTHSTFTNINIINNINNINIIIIIINITLILSSHEPHPVSTLTNSLLASTGTIKKKLFLYLQTPYPVPYRACRSHLVPQRFITKRFPNPYPPYSYPCPLQDFPLPDPFILL